MIFKNLLLMAIHLFSRFSKKGEINTAKKNVVVNDARPARIACACAHATAGMQSADNKRVGFFICVNYWLYFSFYLTLTGF